ncbi:hypothetical protein CHS0354_041904 [Potamilus streckersoni]|uniref:C2H2-type domain-containing protein n=1 Tax=Potamilus streckersoni TaxID=2493646 RepID=A0AAE0ST71_9BIVA|nr:hypothetical protein CHS0354_041904 [Potamilus streckersoni]
MILRATSQGAAEQRLLAPVMSSPGRVLLGPHFEESVLAQNTKGLGTSPPKNPKNCCHFRCTNCYLFMNHSSCEMSSFESLLKDAKRSPEFNSLIKLIIKYEIYSLLKKLSENGEESVIITASVTDGSSSQLGSEIGEGFLQKANLESLKEQFIFFCKGAIAQTPSFQVDTGAQNRSDKSKDVNFQPDSGTQTTIKEERLADVQEVEEKNLKDDSNHCNKDLRSNACCRTENLPVNENSKINAPSPSKKLRNDDQSRSLWLDYQNLFAIPSSSGNMWDQSTQESALVISPYASLTECPSQLLTSQRSEQDVSKRIACSGNESLPGLSSRNLDSTSPEFMQFKPHSVDSLDENEQECKTAADVSSGISNSFERGRQHGFSTSNIRGRQHGSSHSNEKGNQHGFSHPDETVQLSPGQLKLVQELDKSKIIRKTAASDSVVTVNQRRTQEVVSFIESHNTASNSSITINDDDEMSSNIQNSQIPIDENLTSDMFSNVLQCPDKVQTIEPEIRIVGSSGYENHGDSHSDSPSCDILSESLETTQDHFSMVRLSRTAETNFYLGKPTRKHLVVSASAGASSVLSNPMPMSEMAVRNANKLTQKSVYHISRTSDTESLNQIDGTLNKHRAEGQIQVIDLSEDNEEKDNFSIQNRDTRKKTQQSRSIVPRIDNLMAAWTMQNVHLTQVSGYGQGLDNLQVFKKKKAFTPNISLQNMFDKAGNMSRCLVCEKLVLTKNRKYHWLYHTGEKPYKCTICGKSFSHPSNMKTHTLTHNDKRA